LLLAEGIRATEEVLASNTPDAQPNEETLRVLVGKEVLVALAGVHAYFRRPIMGVLKQADETGILLEITPRHSEAQYLWYPGI